MQGLSPIGPDAHAASVPPPADTEDAIRTHLARVWRYLRMHGATPHEADDLAQEAFVISVHKDALGLDPPALATFLRRTGRFLFLRLRRDSRDALLLADAVDQLWERDCGEDDGDGLLERLRACVERLPSRSRRAVELGYGLDASAPASRAAMAVSLGLQENGVKTLMQRVRQQLRACVERKEP